MAGLRVNGCIDNEGRKMLNRILNMFGVGRCDGCKCLTTGFFKGLYTCRDCKMLSLMFEERPSVLWRRDSFKVIKGGKQ